MALEPVSDDSQAVPCRLPCPVEVKKITVGRANAFAFVRDKRDPSAKSRVDRLQVGATEARRRYVGVN